MLTSLSLTLLAKINKLNIQIKIRRAIGLYKRFNMRPRGNFITKWKNVRGSPFFFST